MGFAMIRKVSVVLVVAGLWPALAQAEGVDDATRRAARTLAVTGVEAYEARDYATASEKLEKAYQVLKAPSLGLWSARALVKLNKLVEAAERYQEIARLGVSGGDRAVQQQAQKDAAVELEELEPQIPSLVVRLHGTNSGAVSVTVDGVTLARALLGEKRPVNPGKHRVQATSAGKTTEAVVEVAVGESKTVELAFSDAPASAAPVEGPATTPVKDDAQPGGAPRRTVGFVALGVGGAGLLFGGIASAITLGKKGEVDDNPNCNNNVCRTSESDLVDSYGTWRTVSSVSLIGGAVLAGLGVGLILSAPESSDQTAIWVGPSSIALSRRF